MAKTGYKNYIFDLYGTLVAIHTDEEKPELWTYMSKYLAENFGVKKAPADLKNDYKFYCKEEENRLIKENHIRNPEIKIENVWQRIIKKRCSDDEMFDLCYGFREKSRDRFGRYKGVVEALARLKGEGKHLYLLSNAQRMYAVKELEIAGMIEYFDDLFISSDFGIKKPDAKFLELLIEKHGLSKSDTVLIGNEAKTDGAIARKVGIDAIIEENGNFLRVLHK